jgi:peptide deformylase
MAALDIRTFGDPVLKTRAAPVESFDDALAHLAEGMLVTMHEHEGVGLAANQVGRLRRILVAATEDEEYVIVNPVVEGDRRDHREGARGMPLDTGDPGRGREAHRHNDLWSGRHGRPAPNRDLRPAREDLATRDRPPRRCPDPGPHRP